MDSIGGDDVVISGASGVFPKADNLEQFSEKLFASENLLSDVPSMPCKLGKINDLSKFDAEFFGFQQAHRVNVMDPMARIILEKAYEAIVDSGNNPTTLKGKNVGVYIGIHFLETEVLVYEKIQKGASLAISRSFNANRISYWLGVHGPSFTVDSACSSTLLALEMAYKAIRNGECESAIVGGCHVCLHPALLLHLLKVGALNPNGESRVFDENAGGFCKAEAIGTFYVQKAKDAKRVYARVINVRSSHDGSKKLFLSPHGPSQAKLLKMVYEEANVDLNTVDWIEAHATGTLVGDKQEVNGIDEVFKGRSKALLVGSVKSNMGHAEAAAGVGSISKVLIAMESGSIPPNINVTNVRKDIEAFQSGRMKVITEKTPWSGGIVGVSGFGMGGANTHAVLRSNKKSKINHGIPNDNIHRIIGISGRTEEAVNAFFEHLRKPPLDAEFVGLLHQVYKYDIPLHPYRGFIILSKSGSVEQRIQVMRNQNSSTWIIFSDLLRNANAIYESLEEVEAFRICMQHSLTTLAQFGVCTSDPAFNNKHLYSILVQMAILDTLNRLNITPDNVIGYSLGQLVCAFAGGSLSFEETVRLVYFCTKYLAKYNAELQKDDTVRLKKSLEEVGGASRLVVTSVLQAGNEMGSLGSFVDSLSEEDDVSTLETKLNRIEEDVIFLDLLPEVSSSVLDVCMKGKSARVTLLDQSSPTFVSFLAALGKLYLLGKNVSFDMLYPEVEFPVSKGTKMIAPLVKWKHTVSWPVAFSSLQERMLSGERKVSVSLDDKPDAYICGHEIDSSILYPGAGYLVLIWETLATVYGKMYTDLSVVFESVRFLKATVMPRNEPVTFSVMVQKGNRCFEILENSQLVATGRVYIPRDACQEFSKLDEPQTDRVVFEGSDFYKYILVRNYNFKGEFRSIKQINSRGTMGRVTWSGNWVTYLDSILQFNMLGNGDESLSVPTEIEKIIIDVQKHKRVTEKNPTELDVVMDKDLKVAESGGVQIKNCSLRPIPEKLSEKLPLVQKCSFMPYVSSEKQGSSLKEVVQLCCQCVMDNVGQLTKEVQVVEVLDESVNNIERRPLVSPLIVNFVNEQPQFQANVNVYTNSKFKCMKESNDLVVVEGKLPLTNPVQLLSCSNVLKNEKKFEYALNSLTENGFLIAREDLKTEIETFSNAILCGEFVLKEEKVLLLKKRDVKLSTSLFKVVNVRADSFKWVEEIKEILQNALYERIILLSEKQPLSGILGFFNCLRLERNTEKIRCYFIADANAQPFSLDNKTYKAQLSKDLAVNVLKNGSWGCYVKFPVDELRLVKSEHFFVNMKSCGKRRKLQLCEGPMKTWSVPKEDLIYVNYASVNSTDILLYKNRLSLSAVTKNSFEQDYALGMEFSGHGNDTKKRYMGLRGYGCLSSVIKRTTDDLLINEVPKNWSMEDAATVPLAYYIAIYALIICGKLKNKQAVLIHSPASFVGQAALHIAIYYNCNIFVTISSIDEKLFIKENFPYISESKISYCDSLFEEMIRSATAGKGVHVILNSLSEEKFGANVNSLSRNGNFVQIKKTDLSNGNLCGNKLLSKNISMHSAVLEDILNLSNDSKYELKNVLDEHIRNGSVKPLARTVYCATRLETAFEFASSTKDFGKCVLLIGAEEKPIKTPAALPEICPRFYCDPEKTYIVCGGLGGMGMELVNWLVIRGAKKIIITSRSGVTKASQTIRINKWQAAGTKVIVSKADVSNESETVRLLEEAQMMGSVGGIFNLAAVLRDKMFKNQTIENFETCAASKLIGTYNLDRCSRSVCPNLEQFVVFSSIASGHGNLGQTNYGFCNSSVERICELRKTDKLPALAVEWGAVGNVGMFVSFMDGNTENAYAGNHMQPIKSCLDVLDYSLNQNEPVVISCVVAKKQSTSKK